MSRLTLAHISDLHLSDPTFSGRVLASPKRTLAWLAWRCGKRAAHSREILQAAAEDIGRHPPDAVAVTGDLTQLGLPAEYEEVRRWLPELGETDRVAVVPGNHDVTCGDVRPATWRLWHPWVPEAQTETEMFPTVHRPREGLALIGLSSAHPSGPFWATGRVGDRQRAGLRTALATTGAEGRFRAVLLHHPPCEGVVRHRKRLTDAAEVRKVIEDAGAELVLHGHAHRPSLTWLQHRGRPIPVVGAPSVSDVRHGTPAFNVYTIARSLEGWVIEMEVREYRLELGGFAPGRRCLLTPPEPHVDPTRMRACSGT